LSQKTTVAVKGDVKLLKKLPDPAALGDCMSNNPVLGLSTRP
jgi:hypothetical protein